MTSAIFRDFEHFGPSNLDPKLGAKWLGGEWKFVELVIVRSWKMMSVMPPPYRTLLPLERSQERGCAAYHLVATRLRGKVKNITCSPARYFAYFHSAGRLGTQKAIRVFHRIRGPD